MFRASDAVCNVRIVAAPRLHVVVQSGLTVHFVGHEVATNIELGTVLRVRHVSIGPRASRGAGKSKVVVGFVTPAVVDGFVAPAVVDGSVAPAVVDGSVAPAVVIGSCGLVTATQGLSGLAEH